MGSHLVFIEYSEDTKRLLNSHSILLKEHNKERGNKCVSLQSQTSLGAAFAANIGKTFQVTIEALEAVIDNSLRDNWGRGVLKVNNHLLTKSRR